MQLATALKITSLIASVVLPFFNIPLIIKIVRRGSSKDISMVWALGVWFCILFMLPSVLTSKDIVFKLFGITNTVLFSAVTFCVVKYHKK